MKRNEEEEKEEEEGTTKEGEQVEIKQSRMAKEEG